jgi:glycosyltransferase involved in cell wall biosynthesis
MRVIYITAGAAGMYCGSCMHDNTLVSAMIAQGHDAMLVPTYTPIRTDEPDVSTRRIFFGGVNVYLEQKVPLFRRTPWFLDRLLNARWLLQAVSRFAVRTRAEELGELTLSMLRGQHGYQRKEIDKLVHWLEREHRPELLHLTNVLLSGMVGTLKERLKTPVIATLQGDDIFLESLPQQHRSRALALVKEHCRQFDGFIATSVDYADFMAQYLDIPRGRIEVVYPGLNLKGLGQPRPDRTNQPFTIGYFARICPEKGLHILVEAFRYFKQMPGTATARLRVSGWLGAHQNAYLEELHGKLKEWKLADFFDHVETPDLPGKVRFFHEIDVLSVPATFREPKGLYLLEAWANGVPVVQPRHGSFPELVEATGGGLLFRPGDPGELAVKLHQLCHDPSQREKLGRLGQIGVQQQFHAERMAEATLALYRKFLA